MTRLKFIITSALSAAAYILGKDRDGDAKRWMVENGWELKHAERWTIIEKDLNIKNYFCCGMYVSFAFSVENPMPLYEMVAVVKSKTRTATPLTAHEQANE